MLKKVLVAGLVVVVAFLAFVATRAGSFKVERSVVVAAGPAVVFPLVADLKRMLEWSPWDRRDPAMKRTFTGDPAEVGSSYGWSGNKEVGEGRMVLVERVEQSHATYRLEFLEPFESSSMTSLKLEPEGAGTKVRWSMEGKLGFVEKLFGLFMDMDAMIGKDFDEGLAALKVLAERQAATPVAPATPPIGG